MKIKDGQSGGGALPVPDLDIWDSVSYLSGGQAKPPPNDYKWTELQERLIDSGFTPFEYIYYVANFSRSDLSRKTTPYTLCAKNIVCSDKTWSSFLSFNGRLDLELRTNMHLQKKILNTSARTNGMHYVLKNAYFEIGPSLRVESALHMIRIGMSEFEDILETWGSRAGESLMGIPKLAPYLPTTIKALREDNAYATRYLFPR